MKKLALILIALAVVFTASGCLQWLYEPERDAEGNVQYVDQEATDKARNAGLIAEDEVIPTTEKVNPETGKEREVILSDQLKPGALSAIKAGTGLGDLFFPGLGALLGSVVTGGIAVARGLKKKRKYDAGLAVERGGKLLMAKAATVFAVIVADFSAGKIDTDKDGKLQGDELKAYAAKVAKEHLLDLELATKLVEIGTSSWDASSKERAVKALVGEASAI